MSWETYVTSESTGEVVVGFWRGAGLIGPVSEFDEEDLKEGRDDSASSTGAEELLFTIRSEMSSSLPCTTFHVVS